MRPLLTIAIPTFNRAEILNIALSKILPQINKNNEYIEFIISDNASTDHTQEIIQKHLRQYPKINVIQNIQPENTGYYGNFKKCRELSNGYYFWILSDNEHLNNNVIKKIIQTLKSKSDFASIFLKNTKSIQSNVDFQIYNSSFTKLTEKFEAYKLTLISAVIMRNIKDEDELIFKHFSGNSFLGFIFLCKALKQNDQVIIIKGNFYKSAPAFVTFNIFESWTSDIMACVDYMIDGDILDYDLSDKFIESYLRNNVRNSFIRVLSNQKIHNKKYKDKREILDNLYYYYSGNPYFKQEFKMFYNRPMWYLFIKYNVFLFLRKIFKKMKRFSFAKFI